METKYCPMCMNELVLLKFSQKLFCEHCGTIVNRADVLEVVPAPDESRNNSSEPFSMCVNIGKCGLV